MAKGIIQRDLKLLNDAIVFWRDEEVYVFWFDSEGKESVDNPENLPDDCEGWTLHAQEVGKGGYQLWSPNEWDWDDVCSDDVYIIDNNFVPVRRE